MTKIHLLRNGNYEAAVHLTGASLWALRFKGEDYMPACAESEPSHSYHGSMIAPWPNRIRDGKYGFAGRSYQLPVNEVARNNALHGFSAGLKWKVLDKSEKAISLTTKVGGTEGYPASIELTVGYRLTRQGLRVLFQAENPSSEKAPFGFAFHPYFKIPGEKNPKLSFPASTVLLVDDERLLPVQEVRVDDTPFDFRETSDLELDFLDHAFSDFDWDLAGTTSATLSGNGGRTLTLTWDHALPWLQVHDPRRPELPGAVVIEPMSCPPDAFNSGRDLVFLDKASKFLTRLNISASIR